MDTMTVRVLAPRLTKRNPKYVPHIVHYEMYEGRLRSSWTSPMFSVFVNVFGPNFDYSLMIVL